MATVLCHKCTAERKGFRRELDSWRHKLIHCVGFESILEGIYGPMLMRDLNVFDDCEPEEVEDWSPEGTCAQCSFCNITLDKITDQVPATTSPLSSPSEYSPCQAPSISESSQSAHRFLQAVFTKKDVPLGCDSNIPLVAQELMKKMVHQFAIDYASKCLQQTTTNGVRTRTPSPSSETPDAPLDLTVSRTQEEKDSEPQPDGVLDLSNRNSASSANSLSTNNKGTSSLLQSCEGDPGDLEAHGNKCRPKTALDAIFKPMCPAHRSLFYQILKQAWQEKTVSLLNHRPAGETESYCCHCGVHPQDIIPHAITHSECKAHNGNPYCSFRGCDHEAPGSTTYHLRDSKSNCSTHLYPLKDCENKSSLGSNYCCLHKYRTESYTVLCSKRLPSFPCQNLTVGVNNLTCSLTHSPTLTKSPSLCTPSSSLCPASIYCNQHSCSCCSNQACSSQVRSPIDGEIVNGDLSCPVLKREQSPSPPPLSPIPSDIDLKTDEKPPSLPQQRQGSKPDMFNDSNIMDTSQVGVYAVTKEELECATPSSSQSEYSPNVSLLEDVVSRFSEKLETIAPVDKVPPPISADVYVSEMEKRLCPSTSQNVQFQADAHLTEIITKVLHKGNGSDYDLRELFNRHDSKEPKSPNTRSRRRQEVLAAITTPTDDPSTRRHSLQIKRELAMLDQSCNRRKLPPSKKAKLNDVKVTATTSCSSPDSNLVEDKSQKEVELDVKILAKEKLEDKSLDMLLTEVKQMQAIVVMEDILMHNEKERQIPIEEKNNYLTNTQTEPQGQTTSKQKLVGITTTPTPVKPRDESSQEHEVGNIGTEKDHKDSPSGKICDADSRLVNDCHSPVSEGKTCQSLNSKEMRRSRRNIVPPHRFSSYVTEPRNMFFVACFSEGIFNQRPQRILTTSTMEDVAKETETDEHKGALDSTQTNQSKPFDPELEMMAAKERSPAKHCVDILTDGNALSPVRTLRSSPRLNASKAASQIPINSSNGSGVPCVEKSTSLQREYTSPIKLMYVSEVKDKGEVKYSLKTSNCNSSSQTQAFDPCEESSWSGTLEKQKSPSTLSPSSKVKLLSSPLKAPTSKSATSPSMPSSPVKSGSSTPKAISPQVKSSPPRSSPRKSAPSSSKSTSSPKSVSSSPKLGSRRSAEGTPTKRLSGTESQRSPCDSLVLEETTPPKRRPGRPKKLGPQLEQKVKRPIGRPRKQTFGDPKSGKKSTGDKSVSASEPEENANKNLKITVVYGRSRRNKRTVSEGFEELQTEFYDACQAVGLKSDLGILMHSSETSSGCVKATTTESSKDLKFVGPMKESTPISSSHIKCRKHHDSVPSRKPGRPAKVKISGISVTVTTVSPRQRKIQIKRDTENSETSSQNQESAEEPKMISNQSERTDINGSMEKTVETKNEGKAKLPEQPVAVRHSMRVRKPSIHFLHAIATSSSRSYSHSNALLRRSKQLLLNKASYEKKKEEQQRSVETSVVKKQLFGPDQKKSVTQDLRKMAEVFVDSIFTPKKTVKWWAASTEQKTMNQELARRIRVISDTWVPDGGKKREEDSKLGSKENDSCTRTSRHSSVVRSLFDCSPNKPRSCSMKQLSSWFMQTTETQSLAIVKKTSSRNPYDLGLFPRAAKGKNVCQSPQAERLHKHVKKFAKIVPQSPLQHQRAQRRMRRNETPLKARTTRRQLFNSKDKHKRETRGNQSKAFRHYQAAVVRARKSFLTQKERERRNEQKRKIANSSSGHAAKCQAFCRTARGRLSLKALGRSSEKAHQEQAGSPKDQTLSFKAWSPETIKECRVFLRKINSPGSESTGEELDSCTVTLDDGSPSSETELVKAVKRRRTASRETPASASSRIQEQDAQPMRRERGKCRSPEVVSTDLPQPLPAKVLRQSRMRGFTGPRWCDFVICSENG